MSALSVLPNELLIHVFWLLNYKDVLKMRLVASFCKEIIDSSSQLRLIIELGRDGKYPIYTQTLTSSTIRSLELHLRTRARWDHFVLLKPRLTPPQDHEFHLYEFTGGVLAHCMPGDTKDSISFQSLRGSEEVHEKIFDLSPDIKQVPNPHVVPLPFKCAELSFDWVQDLLVVVEDRNPYFPVHLYSASTGGYHPRAAKFIFDDLLSTTTTGIDVEIMIDEYTVVLAYKPVELHGDAQVSAFDWVTGEILFRQETAGASSVTLLSPRYLMTLRCGYTAPHPSLDIYDLADRRAITQIGTQVPFLRLSLLELSDNRTLLNVFAVAYFIQGTHNSPHADAGSGMARNGDTDIICVQIRMSREHPADHSARIYFFVSKKRLLDLASDGFGQPWREQNNFKAISKRKSLAAMFKNAISFRSPTIESATFTKEHRPILELAYADWTRSGRFVRWIDGSKLQGMTRCATHGSKFACIGNPHDLGLVGNKSIGGTDRGFVCILEFNEGLFWGAIKRHREGVITTFENASNLTNGLNADTRGGLTYKITWLKKPSAFLWLDLLLDSNYVVGRLMEGFELYAI